MIPPLPNIPFDKLKPSDRVLAYLQREIGLEDLKPGTRLPPVRQIATAINVSHGTARNILLKLAEQGFVEIKPGSGASWIREQRAQNMDLVIGVNTIRPEAKSKSVNMQWLYRMYGGISKGALISGVTFRMKPILKGEFKQGQSYVDFDVRDLEGVDGFILFPFFGFRELEQILQERKIPYVYFNPPHHGATEGFVSPSYFSSCEDLGKVWAKVGKKRVLGMFSPGPEKSVSCQLMSAGLMSGLAIGSDQLPEVHKLTIEQNDMELAEKSFTELLDTGWVPDAVLCKEDVIAMGVLNVARSRGIQVPEQMSVVGGNGMSYYEPTRSPLTVIRQPIEEIGESLVNMLLEKIQKPSKPQVGIYKEGAILAGETTTDSENQYFNK